MVAEGYLLDSNIVIAALRDRTNKTGIRSKLLQVGLERCYVSDITLAELASGAHKMDSERGYFELSFVKSIFTPISFGGVESNAAEIFGELKASLEKKGVRLADMDLLIASTAIDRKLVLVSHNLKHFPRIPNLELMDWL